MRKKSVFQIDQSGKIEQTNKDTVLCLANDDKWDAITIKAKTKRQIQTIFRNNKQPRNFVIFTFCAGISILLNRNKNLQTVTIDREYFGKEAIIKEIILEMLRNNKRIPEISFDVIGRRVQAHLKGYLVYVGKVGTRKIVDKSELLKQIKKTEVEKRLKGA